MNYLLDTILLSELRKPVEPDEVFLSLEEQRKSGSLQRSVTNCPIRYQASQSQPGMLEHIDPQGIVTTGRFKNGEFIVQGESDS